MSNETDNAVERLVLAMFLRDWSDTPDYSHEGHLSRCPSLRVEEAEGRDGSYGCETGCEYVQLEAVLVCGHEGFRFEYDYGTFGELAGLLEDLIELENEGTFRNWLELRRKAAEA